MRGDLCGLAGDLLWSWTPYVAGLHLVDTDEYNGGIRHRTRPVLGTLYNIAPHPYMTYVMQPHITNIICDAPP
jgi:hypothetical protein